MVDLIIHNIPKYSEAPSPTTKDGHSHVTMSAQYMSQLGPIRKQRDFFYYLSTYQGFAKLYAFMDIIGQFNEQSRLISCVTLATLPTFSVAAIFALLTSSRILLSTVG